MEEPRKAFQCYRDGCYTGDGLREAFSSTPPPPFDVLIAVGTSMSSHVDLMNKYVLNQPIYYISVHPNEVL